MRSRTLTCLAVAAATGLAGCTEVVLPNDPPVAKVTMQYNGMPLASAQGVESTDGSPITVTLDGSGSTDEDGSIAGFRWMRTDVAAAERMGTVDGGISDIALIELGSTVSVSKAFGPGTHRVTLWVVDDGGAVSEPTSVTISVTSASQCLAVYENPVPGCAECLCKANAGAEAMGMGGCRDQIMACMANPDPSFAQTCTDLVNCAVRTGCSGALCYGAETCIPELDAATVGYGGFPTGCQAPLMAGDAPCPTATAIATCRDMRSECMAICLPPATM